MDGESGELTEREDVVGAGKGKSETERLGEAEVRLGPKVTLADGASLFQAGCPLGHPINSVIALKRTQSTDTNPGK